MGFWNWLNGEREPEPYAVWRGQDGKIGFYADDEEEMQKFINAMDQAKSSWNALSPEEQAEHLRQDEETSSNWFTRMFS